MFEKIKEIIVLKESTDLNNPDLIPLPPSRRLWNLFGYLTYWGLGNLTISIWMGASSLLSLNLNVSQTMGVIVVGNFIINVLAVLNGQIGTDNHIGFSISQRVIFGMKGSSIGIFIRIVLSVVWFASQAWIGGLCVNCVISSFSKHYLYLPNTFPELVNMTSKELIGFVLFQIISVPFLFIKPERYDKVLGAASFVTFFVSLGIVSWAVTENHGNGPLMSGKIELTRSETSWAWIYGITSWYGALAAGVTNHPDFTRFAKTPSAPLIGTIVGCNVFGIITPLMGTVTASALEEKYGEQYWMPTSIINLWMETNYTPKARAGAFFAGLAYTFSQASYNTYGNGFAGGMDLSGLFSKSSKIFNIRRGSIFVALLSWVVQPWLMYNTSSTFVTVMSSFSVFMTPLIAIVICDYWLIRKRKLKLKDLYSSELSGSYHFYHGVNIRAVVSWLLGFIWGVPGLAAAANPKLSIPQGLHNYYKGSLFFGFCIAFVLYYIFCLVWPISDAGSFDKVDYYGTYTEAEAIKKNMIPFDVKVFESEDKDTQLRVVTSHPELKDHVSMTVSTSALSGNTSL
ncbi:uncharacterized protein PRCAT00005871001 [Priceomyces carsonii]|uniref:uncharacterized protein n=1 Tax=Priceomyces carsonii TaxID=28549 RepID=UPI002EDAB30E|nr:unnamed protein product [Priceomyces carsonii]